MICRVCGHQEYRLTRQTINAMLQKYKSRRTLYLILFVISLIGVVMFSQAVFSDDSKTSNTTNIESTSIENSQEENDMAYYLKHT